MQQSDCSQEPTGVYPQQRFKTAKYCKKCLNHKLNRSTCGKFLTQLKFPTGKFRESCKQFKSKIIDIIPFEKPKNELKNQKEDYLSALDCYYEFRLTHQPYFSIYDFYLWCRNKIRG